MRGRSAPNRLRLRSRGWDRSASCHRSDALVRVCVCVWPADASLSGPQVSVGPSDISCLFSPMAVVCVGVSRPCAQRLPAKR